MVTTKERLERIENALIALGSGGAGFAAGRMGAGQAVRSAGRLALGTPAGRAALAGFSYSALRDELNERDRELAEQELGAQFSEPLDIIRRTQPLPIPVGRAAVEGVKLGKQVKKRAKTKFNKAVSAGMKAVKQSKFGGKKGTIKNAKSTFSTVNKVVSAVNKGKKVARSGVRGVIARAARKYL
jgi:hypothetical protein